MFYGFLECICVQDWHTVANMHVLFDRAAGRAGTLGGTRCCSVTRVWGRAFSLYATRRALSSSIWKSRSATMDQTINNSPSGTVASEKLRSVLPDSMDLLCDCTLATGETDEAATGSPSESEKTGRTMVSVGACCGGWRRVACYS